MTLAPIPQTDLLGSREIQFLNREESLFPHLLRLSMDFSFRILEVLNQGEPPTKHYLLVTDDYRHKALEAITPAFDSLQSLNDYVGQNMVDILHDYLFGFVEDDIRMAGQQA